MDLNPIGKHCALQSCNDLDFLPLQCSCLQWFCKLHISPDLHDCSSVQHCPSESASSSTSARAKCAFLGCSKPSLATGATVVDLTRDGESRNAPVPRGCPGCQFSFCVEYVRNHRVTSLGRPTYITRSHRHMQSHSCTGLTIGKDDVRHEAARAALAQNFLVTSNPTSHTPAVTRRPRNLPLDSQKLAQLQRVNLMKLRHKAVPGDPKDRSSMVPVDQRIHVTVRLEILGQSTREATLWFRKVM